MRLLTLALVAALVSVTAATPLGSRASSATAIEVVSQNAANRFPDGIQFSVFLSSDSDIQDVRLRFRILPDGVNATARPQCTTGRSVNCNATVGSTAQNYMVPGAKIVFSWEASDAGGARVQSPEQTISYDDDRFRWDSINEGNLTVFFYFGDLESQRNVLRVAQETIGRMSDLLNTQVDFPINIWVYRTAQEMQPAVASRRGQGPDTSVQTLGEVGASDTALVSRDTDFLNIVRHELAHIVTRAGTRSHIVEIPVWINEGLSTYSQRELLPNEEQALRLAIQRNRVLPITSLGTSARGSSESGRREVWTADCSARTGHRGQRPQGSLRLRPARPGERMETIGRPAACQHQRPRSGKQPAGTADPGAIRRGTAADARGRPVFECEQQRL
jgi:hypothetical protein